MRADWIECTLDNVCYKITDGSHNPPKKQSIGLPMLSARNIENNKIVFDDYRFISESEFIQEDKRTDVSVNDILLTIVATIGRSAIVKNINTKFTLQRSVAVLGTKINPYYLNYQLQGPILQSFFINNAKGTAQKGVYLKTLSTTPIILSPFPEQRAIVKKIEALFSSLDAGIADLKKAQDQLKIYRQAVLKKAFEGELTKEWRVYDVINKVPLKEILILSSLKHKAENPEDLFYIGLEHIEKDLGILTPNAGIDLISTVKNKFEENNILYGKLRPYLNKVYLSKESGVCSTDILVFKISEKVLGKFIHQFMLSREFVNDMSNNTSGVNLPRVSTKYIENYLVPLPSLDEQAQIVKEIDSRLSVCDAVEQQIKDSLSQAEALRQSILKRAFEGKLLTEEEIKACQLEEDYEPAAVLLGKIKAEKEALKPVKKSKK